MLSGPAFRSRDVPAGEEPLVKIMSPQGSAAERLPLAGFEQVHTQDVDEARQAVAAAFCPHQLNPLDRARQFDTRFHSFCTDGVGVSYLDYGGRVHIIPYEQETFYLVLMPLAGRAEISCGREWFEYDSNAASVPPIDRKYALHVAEGSPHLAVWIARTRLEEYLHRVLARPVVQPIRFTVGMDLRAPAVQSWRKVVDLLLDEVDGGGLIPTQPLAMRELERLLMGQLLLAQANNYSTLLHEQQPTSTTPKAIRHAREVMETHAAEPLTLEDIAAAAGLSARALQVGFRQFFGTTPMNYLREVRLRGVREELAAADPTNTTVTGIAIRWGFLHAGRFSGQYRRRFGEAPSYTLRH
jgi:AraC-like DNA-binding protein